MWAVPNTPSVRISDVSDFSLKSISTNVFTIFIKSVQLTSPNGGEKWLAGSQQKISWTSNGINSVKIEYTTDDGLKWLLIADDVSGTNGYYWTLPNSPSANCKVRISDYTDASVNAISSSPFTIFKPQLTLLSPNGGENWYGYSVKTITWSCSDVANVKIEYTINGGQLWAVITESVSASAGSYSWTLPDAWSTSCKIRISDAADNTLFDVSNNYFGIMRPTLLVLFPNGGEVLQGESMKDIEWHQTGCENVRLEYTTNGQDWILITASTIAYVGKYTWTVPERSEDGRRMETKERN